MVDRGGVLLLKIYKGLPSSSIYLPWGTARFTSYYGSFRVSFGRKIGAVTLVVMKCLYPVGEFGGGGL